MIKILGLVVARGGSKRIPRKNVKNFLGKPLVAWSIDVGVKSGIFDRIVLSTEDDEIAEIGRKYGAEVPFKRPAELAGDIALADDTIRHAIQWLRENEEYDPDWVFLLEPTAPAKQPFHLRDVADIIKSGGNFDSISGVSDLPQQYNYTMQITFDENNMLKRAWDGALFKDMPKSSREIPKAYLPNPQIYAFKADNLFKGNGSMWGNATYGYMMDDKYNIDIDTPDDWQNAELRMSEILEELKNS